MSDQPPAADEKGGRSWLQRILPSLVARRGRGDVIAGNVGEGAHGVAVGKNIVQIGTLVIPTLPLLAILFVLIAASAVWAATSIGPAEMSGSFNVAVAEFGQLDADGQVRSSQDGRLLSEWIFKDLQEEYKSLPPEFVPQLWHDSLGLAQKRAKIGIVAGRTPQERQQTAAKLAARINAHLVIYGNLDVDQNPGSFIPEFYVSALTGQADEILGTHQLGTPILLDIPIDLHNPVTGLALNAPLSLRAAVLTRFTVGLMYDMAGLPQKAYDVFQQMEADLSDWKEEEGKEILYLFQGREAASLKREDEAAQAYEKALGINPDYARAYIGLGNLHYERAKKLPSDKLLESGELDQAIDFYRKGLEVAPRSPGAMIEAKSHLALALPLRLKGEAQLVANDLPAAEVSLAEAAAEAQKTVDLAAKAGGQEQYLAAGYLVLGAALHQRAHARLIQGDGDGSRGLFEQASTAYGECARCAGPLPLKRGGDLKPICLDQQKAVQDVLQQGGGAP